MKRSIIRKLFWMKFGRLVNNLSLKSYMRRYVKFLASMGIIFNGVPNYIAPDAYFDFQDSVKITISDSVVISKEVMVLTHDYSIARGIQALHGKDWSTKNTPHFLRDVFIDENSFIGARAFLLPGSHVGKNCIVGGGAVIRGIVPDNSIVMGNPAVVVGNTKEWTQKQILLGNILE